MEDPANAAPPLVAAPRHLGRRRLHGEIPDALVVPGAVLFSPGPADSANVTRDNGAQSAESQQAARELLHRRKRLVALVAIVFLVTVLTALGLALLLG